MAIPRKIEKIDREYIEGEKPSEIASESEIARRTAEQKAERNRTGDGTSPVADWSESLHTHPGMGNEEAESDEIQEEVRRHRRGKAAA